MNTHSENSIIHVFDKNEKQGIIPWQDDLVKATGRFRNSSKIEYADRESFATEIRKSPPNSFVHYHSLHLAAYHKHLVPSNIPFSIDLVDYFDPGKDKDYTIAEKRKIQSQRWILEHAEFIGIERKEEVEKIEGWFIEQPLYGGGEFFYNYDNAQKISSKCIQLPLLLNEKTFDFQRIKPNKLLWMSAVHGIDPDAIYFSMSGAHVNWQSVIAFVKKLRSLTPHLKILVFNGSKTEDLSKHLERENIPTSLFVHLNPKKSDVAACLDLAKAHLHFSGNENRSAAALKKAQELMGKFIISIESEGNKWGLRDGDSQKVEQLINGEVETTARLEIRKQAIINHGMEHNLNKLEHTYDLPLKNFQI